MGRACSRGSGCRPPARHVSRAAGSRGSADGLCLAARWIARKLRPAPTCPGAGTRGEEAGGPGHEVSMRAGVQPWRAMRCAREERAGFFFCPPVVSQPQSLLPLFKLSLGLCGRPGCSGGRTRRPGNGPMPAGSMCVTGRPGPRAGVRRRSDPGLPHSPGSLVRRASCSRWLPRLVVQLRGCRHRECQARARPPR